LPFDHLWDSGPKRLTQGWSLFPIVTWHTGLPFDVFANLGEQYTYNAEGPSGAGDPGSVHANITGPLNTLNPHKTQTINGTAGQYYFNPNSLSNAQCGDETIHSRLACRGRQFCRRIRKCRQTPRSQPMEPCRAITPRTGLH
jgi:hypothetical protein